MYSSLSCIADIKIYNFFLDVIAEAERSRRTILVISPTSTAAKRVQQQLNTLQGRTKIIAIVLESPVGSDGESDSIPDLDSGIRLIVLSVIFNSEKIVQAIRQLL